MVRILRINVEVSFMKKVIIAVVLVGMFGWAIYEFLDKPETAEAEETEDDVENEEAKTDADDDSKANNPLEEDGESDASGEADTVGLEAGNVAPDFELETLDGDTVKLSDFRGER